MTLQQWMDWKQLNDRQAAELFGCDRSRVHRIRTGAGRPSDDLKLRVAQKTEGAVPVDSWFMPASEAA